MKRLLKLLALLTLLFLCYILGSLLWGTFTDYSPKEKIAIRPNQSASCSINTDSILRFAIWNVGYGGLGPNMEFFFDADHFFTSGDKMIRDTKENIESNVKGALAFLEDTAYDFYLLQEVDINSKRSYYIDQYSLYESIKKDFDSHFYKNFDVKRVPIPILEPWKVYGKTLSGLGALSRYKASKSLRLQLPGFFAWPDRIFQIDRCIGYLSYDLPNGKKLVVLNIHNSAYDEGGFLKKQEMEYFQKLITKEYEAGNYVVAGGDWNQCPPGFAPNHFLNFERKKLLQSNIATDFVPNDWKWVYDETLATNRKTHEKYVPGESMTALIDFFLISPNIELAEVKGVDQDFQFSDHQPVTMSVRLK